MGSMSSILKKSNKEKIDKTDLYTVLLEKTKPSSEVRENKKNTSSSTGLEKLALKSTKFYNGKIELSP